MTKLMFALGQVDHGTLREAGFREALAAVGVRRLQLNLDDAHTEAALRIATAEPVRAVVSTWAGPQTSPLAVADVIGEVSTHVAGWRVDEHRRLDPPEAPDGERADALANVALIRKPAELSSAEWLRRWLVEHTPVAIRTQASFGYVQNVVVEPVTAGAPPLGGLVEELFPQAGMTDPHAFYGSGGDDAELGRRLDELLTSVARIGADRDLDLVPSSRYCYCLG